MFEYALAALMEAAMIVFRILLPVCIFLLKILLQITYWLVCVMANVTARIMSDPKSRRVALRVGLMLLLILITAVILPPMVTTTIRAVAAAANWLTSSPEDSLLLLGIGIAVLCGVVTCVLVIRPGWRAFLLNMLQKLRLRPNASATMSGIAATATPVGPTEDDPIEIRMINAPENGSVPPTALTTSDVVDEELLSRIVIQGGE